MSREQIFAYAMSMYGLTTETDICVTKPMPVKDNLALIRRIQNDHYKVMMYFDEDDELKFVVTL